MSGEFMCFDEFQRYSDVICKIKADGTVSAEQYRRFLLIVGEFNAWSDCCRFENITFPLFNALILDMERVTVMAPVLISSGSCFLQVIQSSLLLWINKIKSADFVEEINYIRERWNNPTGVGDMCIPVALNRGPRRCNLMWELKRCGELHDESDFSNRERALCLQLCRVLANRDGLDVRSLGCANSSGQFNRDEMFGSCVTPIRCEEQPLLKKARIFDGSDDLVLKSKDLIVTSTPSKSLVNSIVNQSSGFAEMDSMDDSSLFQVVDDAERCFNAGFTEEEAVDAIVHSGKVNNDGIDEISNVNGTIIHSIAGGNKINNDDQNNEVKEADGAKLSVETVSVVISNNINGKNLLNTDEKKAEDGLNSAINGVVGAKVSVEIGNVVDSKNIDGKKILDTDEEKEEEVSQLANPENINVENNNGIDEKKTIGMVEEKYEKALNLPKDVELVNIFDVKDDVVDGKDSLETIEGMVVDELKTVNGAEVSNIHTCFMNDDDVANLNDDESGNGGLLKLSAEDEGI